MRRLFLTLAIYLTALVGYAQQTKITNVGQHIGVITLTDDTVIEGNLVIDFEQHTILFQQEHKNRLLPFSMITTLAMYDCKTHVRREFIGLNQNDLYEVVLSGDLSLLRYYRQNAQAFDAQKAEVRYFLYETQQEILVDATELAKKLGNIFLENTTLIKSIIKSKKYDLTNIQHIASLVRYQNQCRAKSIATR